MHVVSTIKSGQIARVMLLTPTGTVLVHVDKFTPKAATRMAKTIRAHLTGGGKLDPAHWTRA